MSTISDVKDAIGGMSDAFEIFKKGYDEKLATKDRDIAQLRDRIEEIEARGSSPGRTAAIDYKDREHTNIFIDVVRHWDNSDAHTKLRNFEALEHKDVTIGSLPGGGYALPEEILREVGRLELIYSPVRRVIPPVRCSTNDFKQLVDQTGTTSGWVGETGTRSATLTPTLRERAPTFGELYAYPSASEWSLDDVFFDVGQWLADSIAREFAKAEGLAIISGNGTSKPTGFLNTAPVATADFASPPRSAAAYQSVASDLTPGGSSILPDSLIDVVYTLNTAYRARATWVMNSLTAAAIMRLKSTTNEYLWRPGLTAGQPDRLLGYPVEIFENMPAIGAGNFPVAFGDWQRGYLLAERSEIRITRDTVTLPGYTKFYARRREGGCILDGHAVKVLTTL